VQYYLLDTNGECAPATESGDRPTHPRRLKEVPLDRRILKCGIMSYRIMDRVHQISQLPVYRGF
jgi:hypothetical protein